ncbi:hypothetical protein [Fontivita pretiosa]|jgi:hypothetical protein|uniref:hypothetical protein n=1 Tax=Fontivita pretiosa TaxID=2989684 RepID=UPI003D16431C
MNSIDLKEQVRVAIRSEWSRFEQEHPHLAAAIDQEILIEQAARAIADDSEYQQTMAQAAAAGMIASGASDLIRRLVGRFLRELF